MGPLTEDITEGRQYGLLHDIASKLVTRCSIVAHLGITKHLTNWFTSPATILATFSIAISGLTVYRKNHPIIKPLPRNSIVFLSCFLFQRIPIQTVIDFQRANCDQPIFLTRKSWLLINYPIAWAACLPRLQSSWANMGPTWVLSVPDGPHVGLMNLVIRVCFPEAMGSAKWYFRIGDIYIT